MLIVEPYTIAAQERWDQFVRDSKNGTFLLLRGYMDYHSDRFVDASLIVSHDSRWVALLPATRKADSISSHAGLTYGGLIVDESMTTPKMLAVFDGLESHLLREGVRELHYKTIPHIYHRYPAEEDRYALFRVGALLQRRDVLSVLEPSRHAPVQERRRRGMNKARKAGLQVRRGDDFSKLWGLLEENLQSRHKAAPVHSLAEIELLGRKFPEQIAMQGAWKGDELLAGVVMYQTERVAHVQYIASSEAGRDQGALDLLFDHLIHVTYRNVPVFDFGISNEEGGRVLNAGLVDQKEGFGARAVVHDHYVWTLGHSETNAAT